MYKFKRVVDGNTLPQIGTTLTEIDLNDLTVIEKLLLRDGLNKYEIHAESTVLKEEVLKLLFA